MTSRSILFAVMILCGLGFGNDQALFAKQGNHKSSRCNAKKDPLVGTWNIQFPVSPDSDAIAYGNLIFFADGSLMGADSTGIGAFSGLPINTFQTPLTGEWKCVGHRQYKIFFTNVAINDETREIIGRSRFEGILTLCRDKKSFTLDFSSGVFYDKDNICLTNPPLFAIPALQTIGCKISF